MIRLLRRWRRSPADDIAKGERLLLESDKLVTELNTHAKHLAVVAARLSVEVQKLKEKNGNGG